MTAVLTSANAIASTFYRDREAAVAGQAERLAAGVPAQALLSGDLDALKASVSAPVMDGRVGMVEIYRLQPGEGGRSRFSRSSRCSRRRCRRATCAPRRIASRRRLPPAAPKPRRTNRSRTAVSWSGPGCVARDSAGKPIGVVIASDYLSGDLAEHARHIADAYEDYSQLRVLKRPLEGVYLSLFVMMTLMILVSATWLGLYLAKRITRPVGMLAAGAREIGAGHLDHRIEPETRDEFGSLVEAFNSMAGELATSQRRLERTARRDGAQELRARRAPALHRDGARADRHRRACRSARTAASARSTPPPRGCSTSIRASSASPVEAVLGREDLLPLAALVRSVTAGSAKPAAQEIALARDGREIHLAAAATPLQGEAGAREGTVLVFDDVTPLVRTQRVAAWRDVARRLAHEIKNPLTPIQLSAERMGRHFGGAPEATRALVEECTSTIVGEVESLKALVDEFAQFARMPAPRAVPSNLNAVLTDTLALYNGLFSQIEIDRQFAPALPPVRLDVEQIRRVVINLVDNAIEALGGMQAGPRPDGEPPRITIETQHDAANAVARIVISDNGPGIPAGRSREAVHAVLLDQGPRQRPRPGDRPAHRRRARRDPSKSGTTCRTGHALRRSSCRWLAR